MQPLHATGCASVGEKISSTFAQLRATCCSVYVFIHFLHHHQIKQTVASQTNTDISSPRNSRSGLTWGISMDLGRTLGSQLSFNLAAQKGGLSSCHMDSYGWLVVWTPLKNMKVTWDDYSIYLEKYKMFQTTNQKTTRVHLVPSKRPANSLWNMGTMKQKCSCKVEHDYQLLDRSILDDSGLPRFPANTFDKNEI